MIAVYVRDMHEIDGLYVGEFAIGDLRSLEDGLKNADLFIDPNRDPLPASSLARQWVPGTGEHAGRLVLEVIVLDPTDT